MSRANPTILSSLKGKEKDVSKKNSPRKSKTQKCLKDRELNQARSKPDTVHQPATTADTIVHHYTSTQYCNTVTESVFSTFPFLQTNITTQMWPNGGNGHDIDIYCNAR